MSEQARELERALAELRDALLAERVIRFVLRNGFRITGAGFLLVSALCVSMGLFSAWQVWDEGLFALIGLALLWIELTRSDAWRAYWK